ncbi:amidase domain-containing protein [Halobacillus sp. K22]|uniref:amidase domain-containing protein n=1 Tax=Halobacillus sp. K22 TaxID=3457431 RepID=UPI003FCDE30B
MKETNQIQNYWEKIISRLLDQEDEMWLHNKVRNLERQGLQIERATFRIKPYHRIAYERHTTLCYMLSLSLLVKDQRQFYLEEGIYEGRVWFEGDKVKNHMIQTETISSEANPDVPEFSDKEARKRSPFTYNRRDAVRYAERWWDSYNPAYRHFDVDCTNYVSQCLRAGGAPVWGAPNRSRGWWYSGSNWSFSWAVAHAFRWYLSGARQGLTATEVSSAQELSPGDVICYDFEGNGRFDHNTIVVKKNTDGMPLVNAHTSNSRHRYWAYEDSTAYTPDIQYKFFRIGD